MPFKKRCLFLEHSVCDEEIVMGKEGKINTGSVAWRFSPDTHWIGSINTQVAPRVVCWFLENTNIKTLVWKAARSTILAIYYTFCNE